VKNPRKSTRTASVRYRAARPAWRRFPGPVIFALVVAVLAYDFVHERGNSLPSLSSWTRGADSTLQEAYLGEQSGVQVQGEGVVTRVLADDLEGSRHQRFILRLDTGQTVLVAHNIDLAPRIGGLRTGDTVAFYGEYDWNPKGGVIHWTHHDPDGRHAAGWLRHGGKIYQ
jgi:hypothetical protein